MQDLNHDMEELLRRAAVDYPLKDGDDRWDEIGERLLQTKGADKPKSRLSRFGYTAFLLLLFLHAFLFLNKYTTLQYKSTDFNKNENNSAIIPLQTFEIGIQNSTSHRNVRAEENEDQNKIVSLPGVTDIFFRDREDLSDQKVPQQTTHYILRELPKKANSYNEQFENKLNQLRPAKNKLTFSSVTEKQASKQLKTKHFYYGITSTIHLSAIKELKFEKTGFDIGVHGGYRTGYSTSLEAGLLFSKKYYWTPGKYFSMDEMQSSMPPGMEMKEVNGSSMTFELPLHFRYTVSTRPAHNWYASTGFSSYFMTQEKNQYRTMMNGTESRMYGNYTQNRNYFAASFDLGFGFEKQTGRRSRLRLEPYIQLPIRSVGIGQLPVKSAGLRLGIFRY